MRLSFQRRRLVAWMGCLLLLLVCGSGGGARAQGGGASGSGSGNGNGSGNVNAVLDQMDAASRRFESAEADFTKDLYERVVKQTTTQTGEIYFVRHGAEIEMGAAIAPPQARTLEYRDGRLRIYEPGSKHLSEFVAGANQAAYESYLTLGFGGRGSDLKKAWTITDGGTSMLSDGVKLVQVTRLDLVAKDPNVRNTFSHVSIWVDPVRGISLKQEFVTPSEDRQTAVYKNIRYNEKLTKADLARFAIPGKR